MPNSATTVLPFALFQVKLGKVVDAACSGELWRGMTWFFIKTDWITAWSLTGWQAEFVEAISTYCQASLGRHASGSRQPLNDNCLRILIVRVWSIIQVEADKKSFTHLPDIVTRGEVGMALSANYQIVLTMLWELILAHTKMIDKQRKVIPSSGPHFAKFVFGWCDDTAIVFGPGEPLTEPAQSQLRCRLLTNLVDRGITIRHQTCHQVGSHQTDKPATRLGLQRSLSSGPFVPAMPIDLIFALVAFDCVRLFKK